jgi:putative FmdB family regulatory protein
MQCKHKVLFQEMFRAAITARYLRRPDGYDSEDLMPLYEYRCVKGHRFEVIQKVTDKPLRRCEVCPAKARRTISQPTLLHNRGIHVFDRVTKDDALRARPSSLKSFKKDRF